MALDSGNPCRNDNCVYLRSFADNSSAKILPVKALWWIPWWDFLSVFQFGQVFDTSHIGKHLGIDP